MVRALRTKSAHRSGFTMVELVVVLIILAVLMAIAAPAYQKYKRRAETGACWAQQKVIATALAQYNMDKNETRTDYPDVLTELRTLGYLRELPQDPGEGQNTWENYESTDAGALTCAVHGSAE